MANDKGVNKTKEIRCSWCGDDEQYQQYHDTVWGRPERSSRELFKKLCLDGQQAGLSWITILRKQKEYEKAFFDFDPTKMSKLTQSDIDSLMQNKGIIRNKLKIQSLIKNANAFLSIESENGDFAAYLWAFVGGKPVVNSWKTMADVPTESEESRAMSKSLKKLGFSFVGPTICYAFMEAVGMVNDHITPCKSYQSCVDLAGDFEAMEPPHLSK